MRWILAVIREVPHIMPVQGNCKKNSTNSNWALYIHVYQVGWLNIHPDAYVSKFLYLLLGVQTRCDSTARRSGVEILWLIGKALTSLFAVNGANSSIQRPVDILSRGVSLFSGITLSVTVRVSYCPQVCCNVYVGSLPRALQLEHQRR